jgi:hypothetical protein
MPHASEAAGARARIEFEMWNWLAVSMLLAAVFPVGVARIVRVGIVPQLFRDFVPEIFF